MCFGTIPHPGLLPSDRRSLSASSPNDALKRRWDPPTTRHSLLTLKIVEKAEELVPGSIPFEFVR